MATLRIKLAKKLDRWSFFDILSDHFMNGLDTLSKMEEMKIGIITFCTQEYQFFVNPMKDEYSLYKIKRNINH